MIISLDLVMLDSQKQDVPYTHFVHFPSIRSSRILSLICFVVALAGSSVNAQTYGGQATAVKATVTVPAAPVVTTAVADTGPLPDAGGTITLASAGTSVAGIVTVGTSTVSSSGSAGDSQSTASVNTLNIAVLGNTINADVVSANTDCACPSASPTGNFSIVNLVINGSPITVTGATNQTIALPGAVGNVILNERILGPRTLTVNAIHLFVTAADLTTTDVIIASARSSINCGPAPTQNIFSGRGTGLRLTQGLGLPSTVITTLVSDTGPLPSQGGVLSVATNNAGLSPTLASGAVTANSSGGMPPSTATSTQSDSRVEGLNVNFLTNTVIITADVLTSNSQCAQSGGVVTCGGASAITNLHVTVLGVPVAITITGQPNQTVVIPVALLGSITLVINEQQSASPTDITVNALHVTTNLSGLAATDLIVASSHSDMVAAPIVTAAAISISGRISDSNGAGLSRAVVTVSDMQGNTRIGLSNPFGYYIVSGVPSGGTYVIRVARKGFTFTPRTISLFDDLSDFNFTPDGNGK